ncbi:MAG: DUF2281 domain-containing protein [Luteolibacter sp.]|uniref:DUF2281 domain-containing protein n=1 Tax=Luteolibacter sp. TaxID=1962973 RepID=UPI003264C62A
MKTLETDAEIHADGSVTLLSPIPSWLKPGRTHVLLVVDSASENRSEDPVTPQPGSLKGFWMAPDFDEPLEDFKEYME